MRKMLKKLAALAISAVFAASILIVPSFAAGTSVGTVKVSTSLNVRSTSSTSGSIIGRLYNGELVTIISTSNGWYKISWYGGTGWVSGSYLTLGNNYTSGTAAQNTVTAAAQRMIGVKYLYGGSSTSGMDCSGLTLYAYKQAGVTLPHSSSQQALMGTYVSRSSLQPGDLVFFSTSGSGINHVGIYLGGGNFVSAQSGLGRVAVASLSNSYWSSVYVTARRILS